jgi:hypothetical protein
MAGKRGVTTTFDIAPARLRKMDRRLAGLRTADGYKVTKRQFFETAIQAALDCPAFFEDIATQPRGKKAGPKDGRAT